MLLKPGYVVVRDRCHSEAMVTFAGTDVKLTSDGHPYLDSAIGSGLYVRQFVDKKVKRWSTDVTHLDICLYFTWTVASPSTFIGSAV